MVAYLAELAPELLEQAKASGATPFCIACHQGHLGLVRFLASQGVDINRANHNGSSPLFYASANGHYDVVRFLLGLEVELNRTDSAGTTAFYAACRYGHLEAAEMLADAGADMGICAGPQPLAIDRPDAENAAGEVRPSYF